MRLPSWKDFETQGMTRVTLRIQGYALYEQTVLPVNALCKRWYIDKYYSCVCVCVM